MMTRAAFTLAAGSLLLGATPAPTPLRVIVDARRGSQDLLSTMLIHLYVQNDNASAVSMAFNTADIFDLVALLRGEHVWDPRYGQAAVNVVRKVSFDRGKTLIQSYEWDGTTNDKRSLPPGTATLRATLLVPGSSPAVLTLPFAEPVPIAQLEKLKYQTEVSVVGEPGVRRGVPALTDGTGTVILSRRLAPSAAGKYVVRGFVNFTPDGMVLGVSRSAPAFENTAPLATPSPTPAPATPPPARTAPPETPAPPFMPSPRNPATAHP